MRRHCARIHLESLPLKSTADHSAETHSRGVAHLSPPKPEAETAMPEMEDQRPESMALTAQLKWIQNSHQVNQLNAVQRMINGTVVQRKHERKPEEESGAPAQKFAADRPVQRAVKANIPNDSRIIIDNFNATDFRSPGRIVRDSQVQGFKVVEFDDDPGVGYRVALHEMSPLDANVRRDYGDPALTQATFGNLTHQVNITCTMDVTDEDSQTASFEVFEANTGTKVGLLELDNAGYGFDISNIRTDLSPDVTVPGLGALLMKIAAEMAAKFGQNQMMLSAVKKGRIHPAPFYRKWGFTFNDGVDYVQEAQLAGKDFDQYLRDTHKIALNMTANTATINQNTGQYVGQQGWRGM